jgi:P4 family phage/plasmid primase-like protien
MWNEMRGFVIDGRYKELDMDNAHPRMLASVVSGKCREVVQKYVDNRDSILAEVQRECGCDKRLAKQLFLRIMYGGTPNNWSKEHGLGNPPSFAFVFAGAITDAVTQLESQNDALFEECKKIAKHKRSTLKKQFGDEWRWTALALFLHHHESRAVEEVVNILSERGVTVVGIIHDSVIVPASCDVDVSLINDAVREKINIEFNFKYKEFEKDREWYRTLVEGSDYNDNGRAELDQMEQAIVEASAGDDQPVARVFKLCHPSNLVWLGTERQWVVFIQPRWVKVCHADIIKMISDTLDGKFAEFAAQLTSGNVKVDGVSMAPVLKKLKSIAFKECVEKELRSIYSVRHPQQWLEKLDEITHVIGFEDGVYDFQEKRFREGLPEDFVTMSCGHSIHTQPDTSIQAKIIKFFEDVLPDEEKREYLLNMLACSIHGDRPNDDLLICQGRSSNGKSTMIRLQAAALGNYFYGPDVKMFLHSKNSDSILSSETAKLKGKRCCMPTEANPGSVLNTQKVRQVTGGDLIQCRDLHKSAIEFTARALLIMGFNDVPSVSDASQAMERRMRILNFERRFVEQPTEPHHLPIDKTLRDYVSSKEVGAQMMLMLIERFNRFGFVFSTPESILKVARDFLAENDMLQEFLDDNIIFTDPPPGSRVSLMDVFSNLKRGKYEALIYAPRPQDLAQMLRNKGITMKRCQKKTYLMDAVIKHSQYEFKADG